MRRVLSVAALAAVSALCLARPSLAEPEHAAAPGQPALAEGNAVAAHVAHEVETSGNPAIAGGEHAPAGHAAHEAAGHGHDEEENLSFSDINWFYGIIGESDTTEPNLLFRSKGMPAPFLATLINWGVLVWLIASLAKKQLPVALKRRKAMLVQGMEEASRVKSESEARLAELEGKLSHVDEEIARIKSDMQLASQLERERILKEADERRTRLERDAARLIETELEAAKEQLRRDMVAAALAQASEEVSRQMTNTDQDRLFNDALGSMKSLPNNSLGGRA